MPTLSTQYDRLVAERGLKDDASQRDVLAIFEQLCQRLVMPVQQERSLLDKLLKKEKASQAPAGIYLWGNVGRGKSMLMDLFFNNAPVANKRRVHFHAFMQEVHSRIHQLRQEDRRTNTGGDPVAVLAQQVASETSLLCFDELQATDVADATLLFRLFQGLISGGVTIVSTSNHPPKSLYTGGIQRERFNKFISLIEEHMRVVSLSSPHDYRHMQLKSVDRRYFYPLGGVADAYVADALEKLCSDTHPVKETLKVQGRKITFPVYDNAIGIFTFRDICETALGPADYLAIAQRCDTIILTGIPKLAAEKRNEAKRFVTLVDALYEHKVELLCTAAVPAEQIYSEGDGSFEFKRTVSRLAEMQSANWGE